MGIEPAPSATPAVTVRTRCHPEKEGSGGGGGKEREQGRSWRKRRVGGSSEGGEGARDGGTERGGRGVGRKGVRCIARAPSGTHKTPPAGGKMNLSR
jgi:hypothetical protein